MGRPAYTPRPMHAARAILTAAGPIATLPPAGEAD
jgi:hypothetical protein